jgi:aminoglycoside phosphotransferase (APT) family kinase protein
VSDRLPIDAALVRRLIAAQFPQWASLPVLPVLPGGNDNRTFRLGERMLVRLPSAPAYAGAVEKEQRWLPVLAPHVPVPIPVPLAAGVPGEGYPLPWSVYGWLPGESAIGAELDLVAFARDTARALVGLRGAPAAGGPLPGQHNWWRGGPPAHYDAETRAALERLRDEPGVDTVAAERIWDRALRSTWDRDPVWFHGDVARGNLLVAHGTLSALLDFGTSGIGDPACDLALAWTDLDAPARAVYRAELGLDDDTWHRGRGWAVWKALITIDRVDPARPEREGAISRASRRTLAAVVDDPE